MRILYHHRTASKDGQAVHITEMIEALRAEGHEVRVVAPDTGEGRGRKHKREMGQDLSWVHWLKAALPRLVYELLELAYSLRAYQKLNAVAKEFNPDVIYERYNLYLLAGAMLKKRRGIPLLLEVNSPLVFERSQHSGGLALPWLARWAEGLAWRSADYVLPVTQVLAGHVMAYGVPESRIVVIPNGINKRDFALAPHPGAAKEKLGLQGKLVLGFTGFIRDWHGVDHVIDWMAKPDAPRNVHLLIVGDGPARTDLEVQALSLGLSESLTVTGVVPRESVPSYVAAFDIALQPAVTPYASPLKLMEYLMLGKAIVAPGTPNLLEILRDGDNAALFDEGVPESLQQTLTRVSRDESLRAHLSQNARETIDRMQLTWLGNARRIVELQQGLAGSPSKERTS